MNRSRYFLLAGIAAVTMFFGRASYSQHQPEVRAIQITAKRFAFSPAQVVLRKGETVKLEITSQDVAHGLYVKALKIDADILPGKTTEVSVTPAAAGTFSAICDQFCGVNHGAMKMTFVVED